MPAKFRLEIVTPDRKFYEDNIESLVIKTPEGEIGILANHIPMVAAIAIGPIKIYHDGKCLEAAVTSGYLEVTREKTIMLVDAAEWPDEIDEGRAKAALDRAMHRLNAQVDRVEHTRSQAALNRAVVRLEVKRSVK